MKSAPIELIKVRIGDPGWRPGHKEITDVIGSWNDFTEDERSILERRLAQMDAPATKVALSVLPTLRDKERSELVRPILKASLHVMNFMNSPVLPEVVLRQCGVLLADTSARVRKATAQAVGSSWSNINSEIRDTLVNNLIESLHSASDKSEIKAMVDALGKSGDQRALEALRLGGHGDGKAIIRLNRDLAPKVAAQDVCRPEHFRKSLPMVLWFLPGLGALAKALPVGPKLKEIKPNVFFAKDLSWGDLASFHIWDRAGLFLGECAGQEPGDLARLVAGHSDALIGSTETGEQSPVRIRLGRGPGVTRAFVWKFAEELQKTQKNIINDGRNAHWEIVFVGDGVVIVPLKMPVGENLWRNTSVEGASSLGIASALVQLAAIKPGERVYDPFCGAGTELILGHQAEPQAQFVGTDIEGTAIEAAKKAAQAAHAKIEFLQQDALKFGDGPFDVVLSNPPFGMRTARGDARRILEAFFAHIGRKLTNKGRLVILSHAPTSTQGWAEQGGLRLTKAMPVSLGRMACELQVFVRRK